MHVSKLPPTKFIGIAVNQQNLLTLLIQATGNDGRPFLHMDIIRGGDRSGRIFFQEKISPLASTVPLPGPMLANDLAKEFFSDSFMTEARFPALNYPPPKKAKGLEVQTAKLNDKLMLIVQTTWV